MAVEKKEKKNILTMCNDEDTLEIIGLLKMCSDKDVLEFITLLRSLDERSRQRTMGYMDALQSLGGRETVQTA